MGLRTSLDKGGVLEVEGAGLSGADEGAGLSGADEGPGLSGADEGAGLSGADEGAGLSGADEGKFAEPASAFFLLCFLFLFLFLLMYFPNFLRRLCSFSLFLFFFFFFLFLFFSSDDDDDDDGEEEEEEEVDLDEPDEELEEDADGEGLLRPEPAAPPPGMRTRPLLTTSMMRTVKAEAGEGVRAKVLQNEVEGQDGHGLVRDLSHSLSKFK